jgi:mono/diheme cytochrome c family protein
MKKTTLSGADDGPRDQWSRGVWIYGQECAGCHGDDNKGDDDSPALAPLSRAPRDGSERASFGSAADVFAYIKAEMPPMAPGTLNDADTWAVMAYILKQAQIDYGAEISAANAATVSLP